MTENRAAGFEFLEDIAIADVAFRAWAPGLESLFAAAAEALTTVMVDDVTTVRREAKRAVELEEDDPEMLLFDFLQELIYFKDAEELLLMPESVAIEERDGKWRLRARLTGERIDRERHPLNADVKAVTMHRFALRRNEDGCEAEVVLDI